MFIIVVEVRLLKVFYVDLIYMNRDIIKIILLVKYEKFNEVLNEYIIVKYEYVVR